MWPLHGDSGCFSVVHTGQSLFSVVITSEWTIWIWVAAITSFFFFFFFFLVPRVGSAA